MVKTSREKGQESAQLGMLKRLLEKRFGRLDISVWKRVEAMTFEQREQLAEDFVTATSLAELGLSASS